jgi:large subunit ribosomal protein L29
MKENADRARGLDAAELAKQLRDTAEQLFRLRFQMSMGQMEGLKKYRSLRKERARMMTVVQEQASGRQVVKSEPAVASAPAAAPAKTEVKKTKAKTTAPAAKAAAKTAVKAKPAAKKTAAAPRAASKPKAAPKPRKSSKG